MRRTEYLSKRPLPTFAKNSVQKGEGGVFSGAYGIWEKSTVQLTSVELTQAHPN